MKSVLIANRGEIAVRIIRTARESGLRTVAIYSEPDRDAYHTQLADQAWNIGPAPAGESYLSMERILAVAAETGAEAVHPGYGFLSENAAFAQAVAEAGLIWVGPPPSAIAAMGDKVASRRIATEAGVPVVPGTESPLQDPDEIKAVADRLGYPVLIKASRAGGGRGMRTVDHPSEIEEALASARREADAFFGSPEVYVEKKLNDVHHIEAQILVDNHHNYVYLGERDCSVQRRHQKLVEEAPSAILNLSQSQELGEAALRIARACEYRSAGTVEFLVDSEGSFYFLEMNTRLQVEHTVTEMVTGVDLVREQLRIAAGSPTSAIGLRADGHAIEMRINAEDPYRNYVPTPGRIVSYREPAGPGVRVDGWVRAGVTIPRFYDNLLAKLVVWAPTRTQAISRAKRALEEYEITGVPTTIPVHKAVLDHPDFISARHHTAWLESEIDLSRTDPEVAESLPEEEGTVRQDMTVEISGRRFVVSYWEPDVGQEDRAAKVRRRPPKPAKGPAAASDGAVTAPMQGTIVKVNVKVGDQVDADDTICVLEAMKMENAVAAGREGNVVELRIEPGDSVATGAVVAVIR
ncbi:MAG: acetyl-CoA carboxylase biotin carboxylase subunit [bacterium]|nr:acetyl-CoA carboxylase biotin carboxylase subunit [bacterium]